MIEDVARQLRDLVHRNDVLRDADPELFAGAHRFIRRTIGPPEGSRFRLRLSLVPEDPPAPTSDDLLDIPAFLRRQAPA